MSLTDPLIDQVCRQLLWRWQDPATYDWFVAYEMASPTQRVEMDAYREELKKELLGPCAELSD